MLKIIAVGVALAIVTAVAIVTLNIMQQCDSDCQAVRHADTLAHIAGIQRDVETADRVTPALVAYIQNQLLIFEVLAAGWVIVSIWFGVRRWGLGEMASGELAVLMATTQWRIEKARAGWLQGLQHLNVQQLQPPGTIINGEVVEQPALLAEGTRTFARDVLAAGLLKDGYNFIGWNLSDEAVYQPEGEDFSGGEFGQTRSGKTVALLSRVIQVVRRGSLLALIDPHMGAPAGSLATTLAPLASAYARKPAKSLDEALATLRWAVAHMDTRLAGEEPIKPQIIVIIDEYAKFFRDYRMSRPDDMREFTAMVGRITSEGGKVLVNVEICSQSPKAEHIGDTSILDNLAVRLVFRLPEERAKLLLLASEARVASRLPRGQALFLPYGATDAELLTIPLTTGDDVKAAAEAITTRLLPQPLSDPPFQVYAPEPETAPLPVETELETENGQAETDLKRLETENEDTQLIKCLAQGMNASEAASAVSGKKPGANSDWKRLARRATQLTAQMWQQQIRSE